MYSLIEMYIWTVITFFVGYRFIRRAKYCSGMMILVTFVSLFYFATAALLGDAVDFNTMPWPQSPEHIAFLSRYVVLWLIIFLLSQKVVGFVFPYKLALDNQHSSKNIFNAAAWTGDRKSFFSALFVGVGLLVLTTEGWWIFARYPDNKSIWHIFDLGGMAFISIFFLLYAYQSGIKLGGINKKISIFLFLLYSVHIFLTGQRSSLIFWVLGCYGLTFLSTTRPNRRHLIVLGVIALIPFVYLLQLMSTLRAWGTSMPSVNFLQFFGDMDLLPSALAHLYYSYDIVNTFGSEFGGDLFLFFGVFLIQILPAFVLDKFGWTFYHGGWRLGDYVIHGGGFFVPAEMYFVGGVAGIVVISIYIGVISSFLDRLLLRVRIKGAMAFREPPVLAAMFATVAIPYNYFYGLQSLNRLLTLPIIAYIAVYLYRALSSISKR